MIVLTLLAEFGTMATIHPDTLQFLREVKDNNNREWFAPNKPRYIAARENIRSWLSDLMTMMKNADERVVVDPAHGVGRIYRDIRFSHNKEPFRTYLGAFVLRAPEGRNCEFYIHFEPGNIFVGGGIYAPEPVQLRLIRDDLAYSTAEIEKIVGKASFKKYFGQVDGERLQRAPKGFQPDHPSIEWLRLKQYLILRPLTDEQVLQANFTEEVFKTFLEGKPFFDYLDRALNFRE